MSRNRGRPPGDYPVGRGKPPKHSQFKKGQSGNPKGRPKGTANFSTDVQETLRDAVVLKGPDGKPKTVSTQRAVLLQLRKSALLGDLPATTRLLQYAAQHNDHAPEGEAAKPLSRAERALLADYLAEFKARPVKKPAKARKPRKPRSSTPDSSDHSQEN